jgi:hypothetical protein
MGLNAHGPLVSIFNVSRTFRGHGDSTLTASPSGSGPRCARRKLPCDEQAGTEPQPDEYQGDDATLKLSTSRDINATVTEECLNGSAPRLLPLLGNLTSCFQSHECC